MFNVYKQGIVYVWEISWMQNSSNEKTARGQIVYRWLSTSKYKVLGNGLHTILNSKCLKSVFFILCRNKTCEFPWTSYLIVWFFSNLYKIINCFVEIFIKIFHSAATTSDVFQMFKLVCHQLVKYFSYFLGKTLKTTWTLEIVKTAGKITETHAFKHYSD